VYYTLPKNSKEKKNHEKSKRKLLLKCSLELGRHKEQKLGV
jgi:hypothetical protein